MELYIVSNIKKITANWSLLVSHARRSDNIVAHLAAAFVFRGAKQLLPDSLLSLATSDCNG